MSDLIKMPDIVLASGRVGRMRTKCGRVYYQLRRLLDAVGKEDSGSKLVAFIVQGEAEKRGLPEDWAAVKLDCTNRNGSPTKMWFITGLGVALYCMRVLESSQDVDDGLRALALIVYDEEFEACSIDDGMGSELEYEDNKIAGAREEASRPFDDEERAGRECIDAPEDGDTQSKRASWIEAGGRRDLGHMDTDGTPQAYLALEMDGCIGAEHSDDWVCDIGKEQGWPKRVTGGVFERNTKYMLAAMNEYEAAFYKILVKHPEWGTRDPWRQVLLDCVLYGGEEIENPAITFYNTIREFDAPGDDGRAIRRRDGATWALDEAADAAEFVNVWAWLWDNRPSMPRIQLAQRMITGLDIDWKKLGL